MKKRLRIGLAQEIGILAVALTILTISLSSIVSGRWYIGRMMSSLEDNVLNVVKITAQSPIIVEGLREAREDGSIQDFVQQVQSKLDNVDVMVVADIYDKRYGHTKADRVGFQFSAQDHLRAIQDGETYVSIGPGTLGDSMRAFTPVRDADGTILGFVMAGTLLDSIAQAQRFIWLMIGAFILLGGGVGVLGAVLMARYIKRSLLGYEPEDIARLYLENQGILATVHEGIIAIDQQERITLINDAARRYLRLDGQCKGMPIRQVFPLSKLPDVLKDRQARLDVPYALGDMIVISNNIPIIDGENRLMGGVCTFRDQTEMTRLAEQMTGVKRIVDALRAATHEFKNKLHVILGMVEMGQYQQARKYIGSVNDQVQGCISDTMNHIAEPTIAALIIGKSQRCNELKIQWELSQDSDFANRAGFDVSALVVILGNLLDNAMDALNTAGIEDRRLFAEIRDDGGPLRILVRDNGPGIADVERIFEKGYTTKAESRGYGLFLLKEQVEKYGGCVEVSSAPGQGAQFRIRMTKGGVTRCFE